MSHDVFISYASEDKQTADAVCAFLESRKLRCWYAPRDIPPGDEWGSAIVSAIGQAGVFVLVMTTQSNMSQFVRREVERAVSTGKPVLPLRMEDIAPSQGLELFVSATHWLDAMTPPLERHLEILATRIKALLDYSGATAGAGKRAGEYSGTSSANSGHPSNNGRKRVSFAGLVLGGIVCASAAGFSIWAVNAHRQQELLQPPSSTDENHNTVEPDEGNLPNDNMQGKVEQTEAEADGLSQADVSEPYGVSQESELEVTHEHSRNRDEPAESVQEVVIDPRPTQHTKPVIDHPLSDREISETADEKPSGDTADPDRQRLIEKAQSPAVQAKLRPFLDKGTWQPGIPNANPGGEIIPMSLKAIRQHGALNEDDQGLMQLLSIANTKGCRGAKLPRTHAQNGKPYDRDRIKWTYNDRFLSLTAEEVSQIREAQGLLIELGEVLLELGLLSP